MFDVLSNLFDLSELDKMNIENMNDNDYESFLILLFNSADSKKINVNNIKKLTTLLHDTKISEILKDYKDENQYSTE